MSFQPDKTKLLNLTGDLTTLINEASTMSAQLRAALPEASGVIYNNPKTADKNLDLLHKSIGAVTILETLSDHADTLNKLITFQIQ